MKRAAGDLKGRSTLRWGGSSEVGWFQWNGRETSRKREPATLKKIHG